MKNAELFHFRAHQESDLDFIYSTWLKGLRYGNYLFELIDQDTYFEKYQKVIENVIGHQDTLITVCCLKEDHDVIIGYCVSQKSTAHWVYVKFDWRGQGIARELCPDPILKITHVTKPVQNFIFNRNPKFIFDPFI